MTRVFPEPAPARMSSGPSMWSTASRCSGLRPVRGSNGWLLRLFYSDALCEVARLVDIAAASDRDVIREQLQWQYHHDWGEHLRHARQRNQRIGGRVQNALERVIVIGRDGDHRTAPGLDFLNIAHHLLEDPVGWRDAHDRHLAVDERD